MPARVLTVPACILFALASFATFGADAGKNVDTAEKVDDLVGAIKDTGAKVILVNVWSTECAPCMAELPILARVCEKYKNDASVAFLGLCLQGEKLKTAALEAATEIVRTKQVAYRNFLWTGKGEALLDKFNIIGTPYTLFVSAEGKILGDIIDIPEDPEQAREAIEKALAKAIGAQK